MSESRRLLTVGGWPNVVLALLLLSAAGIARLAGEKEVMVFLLGQLAGLLVPTANARRGDVVPRIVRRKDDGEESRKNPPG